MLGLKSIPELLNVLLILSVAHLLTDPSALVLGSPLLAGWRTCVYWRANAPERNSTKRTELSEYPKKSKPNHNRSQRAVQNMDDRRIPTSKMKKALIKRRTNAELYLSELLRKNWLWRFEEQVPIGRYFADFFFPDFGLIVELDGGVHFARTEYDSKRDGFISTRSMVYGKTYFDVIRFDNDILFKNPNAVILCIEAAIKQRITKINAYGHYWARVKSYDLLDRVRYIKRLKRGQDLRNMEKALKLWERREHFLYPNHDDQNPEEKCEICCDKSLKISYDISQSKT